MILILKDGRRIAPIIIGLPEHVEPQNVIKGIDIDSKDRDLFGKNIIESFTFDDVAGVLGSHTFSPLNLT
jgi:hypothetical protein